MKKSLYVLVSLPLLLSCGFLPNLPGTSVSSWTNEDSAVTAIIDKIEQEDKDPDYVRAKIKAVGTTRVPLPEGEALSVELKLNLESTIDADLLGGKAAASITGEVEADMETGQETTTSGSEDTPLPVDIRAYLIEREGQDNVVAFEGTLKAEIEGSSLPENLKNYLEVPLTVREAYHYVHSSPRTFLEQVNQVFEEGSTKLTYYTRPGDDDSLQIIAEGQVEGITSSLQSTYIDGVQSNFSSKKGDSFAARIDFEYPEALEVNVPDITDGTWEPLVE